MDGDEQIQNRHRPMTDGSGSFQKVFKNAKAIYNSGIKFGLRCTVSQYSVEKLPESILFFYQYFPKALIGIEPLQECGRCLTTNALAPDMQNYAEKMIEVLKIAKEKNIRIKTSFLRFKRSVEKLSFCGVNGRNFVITPEGYVTGCTRLISKQDCKSKDFYYGYFDSTNKEFVFDAEKYDSLKKFVVDNIPECDNCFARFNCKGDCSVVKADYSDNFATTCSPRCDAIKTITLGMFKLQLGLL